MLICEQCGYASNDHYVCPECGERMVPAEPCTSCDGWKPVWNTLCRKCEVEVKNRFQDFLNTFSDDELDYLTDVWDGLPFYAKR